MNNTQVTPSKSDKARALIYRAFISLVGVIFISIGATFLKESNLGLDPFTALNIGLSKHLGMSLGTLQLSFNVILFIIILIADHHQIGIGTFFNMIIVGYGIQFFSTVYEDHTAESTLHYPLIVVDVLLGLAFFTLGTSLYMEADLGVAPYDAIAPIITKLIHVKYQWVRSTQDILFMVAGVVAGGLTYHSVGIMTIFVAFFAGSLINWWNINLSRRIVDSIHGFNQSNQKIKHVGTGVVHAGLAGVNAIRNAYRYTSSIERNMSVYSNKQLDDMLSQTRHQIHLNNMATTTLNSRYQSLSREINKRHDTETTHHTNSSRSANQ